jgi:hemin uptake protein HemP
MPENPDHAERAPRSDERPEERSRVIDAEELFQGSREVWLEHTGVRYRLRITRRNKLILQK